MPRSDPERFASVYDALYGDEVFLSVQEAFLREHLTGGLVLDAGCGTGQHLLLLDRLGCRPVGLDLSRAMLDAAGARCRAAGVAPDLIQGDIRRLPFSGAFDGLVCLESPLAYLIEDADLHAALGSFHRVLRPGGRLIIDVFDYPATVGKTRVRPATRRFTAQWGAVDVTESHRHDRKANLWFMRQQFVVDRGDETEEFEVRHRFRTRTAPEYAEAVEAAGFRIDTLLPAYPNAPLALSWERRVLIAAQRA